jgi:hypothetical protein
VRKEMIHLAHNFSILALQTRPKTLQVRHATDFPRYWKGEFPEYINSENEWAADEKARKYGNCNAG